MLLLDEDDEKDLELDAFELLALEEVCEDLLEKILALELL